MIVRTFYNGLHTNTQRVIDAASGGSMNKKPAEVYDLIDVMTSNNYERGTDDVKKGAGLINVDEVMSLKAQVVAMQNQMANMSVNAVQVSIQVCEMCAGNHVSQDCQVGNTVG